MSTTERSEGHTPLPWGAGEAADFHGWPVLPIIIGSPEGDRVIALVMGPPDSDESVANAELIMGAVHSHAALEAQVAALTEALAELRETAKTVIDRDCPCQPRCETGKCAWLSSLSGMRQLAAAFERAAATEEKGK